MKAFLWVPKHVVAPDMALQGPKGGGRGLPLTPSCHPCPPLHHPRVKALVPGKPRNSKVPSMHMCDRCASTQEQESPGGPDPPA